MLEGSWKFWSCSIDWSSVINPTNNLSGVIHPTYAVTYINTIERCEVHKAMRCAGWTEILLEYINEIGNEICDVKDIS